MEQDWHKLLAIGPGQVLTYLAGAMIHEARSPLHVMGMHLDLLDTMTDAEEGKPDQRQHLKRHLEAMERSIGRLDALLNQYLKVCHLVRESWKTCHQTLELQPCLDEAREVVQSAGHTLETNLPEGLPQIDLCTQELHTVIVQLVRNGVESMDVEGTIRVNVYPKQDNGYKMLCLEVEDSGSGIEQETAKKVFKLGFTTKEGHLGLGLTLVRQIVQSAGGEIFFQTGDIQGTKVMVALPLAD